MVKMNRTLLNSILCEALSKLNGEIVETAFVLGDCSHSDYQTYSKLADLKYKRNVIEEAIDSVALAYATGDKEVFLDDKLDIVLEYSTEYYARGPITDYKEIEAKEKIDKILLNKYVKYANESIEGEPIITRNSTYYNMAKECNDLASTFILKMLYQRDHKDYADEKANSNKSLIIEKKHY